jgi:hypothetical protein
MSAGQPTLYKEEYAEQAFNYCLLGATDKDLARFFNVCDKTIDNWKKDQPEFLLSIRESKEKADSIIVKSLYNRAKGLTVTEERISSGGENDVITKVTKQLPPDTKAIEFWLKNRQPDKFRDKQEITADITADITTTENKLKDLPPDQLAIIKQMFIDNQEQEDEQ